MVREIKYTITRSEDIPGAHHFVEEYDSGDRKASDDQLDEVRNGIRELVRRVDPEKLEIAAHLRRPE